MKGAGIHRPILLCLGGKYLGFLRYLGEQVCIGGTVSYRLGVNLILSFFFC